MLENIANAFGMERKQICMVGDRLDTDILFGQDGGLSTMLVLSGMICMHQMRLARAYYPQPLFLCYVCCRFDEGP